MEESSLAGWIAAILHPYVTQLIVYYPCHNAHVSRSENKNGFKPVGCFEWMNSYQSITQMRRTAWISNSQCSSIVEMVICSGTGIRTLICCKLAPATSLK